jgi:hypothetical protein
MLSASLLIVYAMQYTDLSVMRSHDAGLYTTSSFTGAYGSVSSANVLWKRLRASARSAPNAAGHSRRKVSKGVSSLRTSVASWNATRNSGTISTSTRHLLPSHTPKDMHRAAWLIEYFTKMPACQMRRSMLLPATVYTGDGQNSNWPHGLIVVSVCV